ncbi:hypothetical protein [Chitinimonas lacunae]|uniref:Uncharacterized protein n=1 Tax=Chitinimonas lacunae TaxID=1963018 RepID=A0ABV8MY43_9NEIS
MTVLDDVLTDQPAALWVFDGAGPAFPDRAGRQLPAQGKGTLQTRLPMFGGDVGAGSAGSGWIELPADADYCGADGAITIELLVQLGPGQSFPRRIFDIADGPDKNCLVMFCGNAGVITFYADGGSVASHLTYSGARLIYAAVRIDRTGQSALLLNGTVWPFAMTPRAATRRKSWKLFASNWPGEPPSDAIVAWCAIHPRALSVERLQQRQLDYWSALNIRSVGTPNPTAQLGPALAELAAATVPGPVAQVPYTGAGWHEGTLAIGPSQKPAARAVRLYDRDTGLLIAQTRSGEDGKYRVYGLDPTRSYVALGLDDPVPIWQADAADGLIPRVTP